MASYPQTFTKLMCLVSWEGLHSSMPVLNSLISFLNSPSSYHEAINLAQEAVVQIISMRDSISSSRIKCFLQPEDGMRHTYRRDHGLLLQTLEILENSRPDHHLAIAFLRLLVGIATCHASASFEQVQTAIKDCDPLTCETLLLKIIGLQETTVHVQKRFNEPRAAAEYSWTAEPGLASMLEDCTRLFGDGDVWPLVEEVHVPVEPTSRTSTPPPQ